MATVKKNAQGMERVKVIPRSASAEKEMFAVCNNKRVPFEVPVYLSERDIRTLKRQKEPRANSKKINIHKIMDDYHISQSKANAVAKKMEGEQMNNSFSWVDKYIIVPA